MQTPALDDPTDALLRDILTRTRTIACIGVSPDPIRPSNFVAHYLTRRGFRVIPINPGHVGTTLFGEVVLASLADISIPIDILDVFRKAAAVPAIVEEALHALPGLSCIWLQIGIRSAAAREMCRGAGVAFIEDRCPKIEYQRLFGELHVGGFATGVIGSKL